MLQGGEAGAKLIAIFWVLGGRCWLDGKTAQHTPVAQTMLMVGPQTACALGSTPGSTKKLNPSTANALKTDNLFPGSCMSVDHFTCDPKGRLLSALGKERVKGKRKG